MKNTGTQTIQRASALLRLIAAHNRKGMRLVDLYRTSGLERPTVHRLVQGLIAEGLVSQDGKSKRYFLGSLLYEMGLAATPKNAVRDICHPYLQTLATRTGDTVFLTERSGFDAVCIDRTEGAFPVKAFVLEIGHRRPLNVGGGAVVMLSSLPDTEIERICLANRAYVQARYPNYSESALWERIHATRIKGYGLNDVLEVPEVRSIAVPIRDTSGKTIAAISVSTLGTRLQGERLQTVASYLFEAAHAIRQQL